MVKSVVPKTAQQNASRNDASSRLIFPALTASIRVRAVLSDGTERSASADYSAETLSLSLTGLPADETIDIYVESLSSIGTVITSWHESRVLSGGPNQITAVLAPISEFGTITFGAFPASTPSAPLARNGVRFDAFNGLAAGDEVHFLYDTGRAEFARVAAFDSAWNELPPVAGGGTEGWVVVAVPADGIVNTMTINNLSSPGYPERTINGFMQAREAVFADSDPGDGTSVNPIQFDKSLIVNGVSLFLRTGNYLSFFLSITNINIHLYGGFSNSSWLTRNPQVTSSRISGDAGESPSTIACGPSSSGRIDGLSIIAPSFGSSVDPYIGLVLDTEGKWIVNRCEIAGVGGTDPENNVESIGLAIANGTPEICNCRISGGSITYSPETNTISSGTVKGIHIYNNAVSSYPYIHGCYIDGGSINDVSNQDSDDFSSCGIHIDASAGACISNCIVWGGEISHDSDSGRTIGILNTGTRSSVAASCIISGGYCTYGNNATSTGISMGSESSFDVLGCTIDGGTTDSTVDMANGVRIDAPTSSTIAACVIYTTAISIDDDYGINDPDNNQVQRISGNAIFACTVGQFGSDVQSINTTSTVNVLNKDNNADDSLTPHQPMSEFSTWNSSIITYQTYLSHNLRPASTAIYAGSSSNEGPATWGVFTAEMLAAYPGLLLDMDGNQRPSTWARGAYER